MSDKIPFFLVFSSLPGTKNVSRIFFQVEHDCYFGVKIVFFSFFVHLGTAIDDGKVRIKAFEFRRVFGVDKHVSENVSK
jgi:hypothetical protein